MSRAVAIDFYAALNQRRFDAVAAMMAGDCPTGVPGLAPGPAAYLAMVRGYLTGFPDLAHEVLETVSEGGTVAVRLRSSGSHTGDFLGHPPTNRRFAADGVDLLRFRDGLIVERIGVFDTIAMLRQLGLYR